MRISLGFVLAFCVNCFCLSLFPEVEALAQESDDTISTTLPECSRRDELACDEECRELFDDEYRQCRSECMQKRCAKKPEVVVPTVDELQLGALCIESESQACNEECSVEVGSARPRCRRSCLEKRCPAASRYDSSKEGIEPGSAACGRCRKEHESSCRRECRMGTSGINITGNSGLDRIGCEKLCVMTACASECGTKIPF